MGGCGWTLDSVTGLTQNRYEVLCGCGWVLSGCRWGAR